MEVDLLFRPGNSAARLNLAPGESCTAEAGAMISMSGSIQVETTTHKRSSGSILGALKRVLAGESFFLNHFTAGAQGGEVWIASTLPGDMISLDLAPGEHLIVEAGGFVACEDTVNIGTSWQGFAKALFAGEGAFWLDLSGPGKIVISAFGSIYPIAIDGEYIVDTGHIVAFPQGLNFDLTKAGRSWLASFLGGEGIVCKFKGRGTVWCQSHNAASFGQTLSPELRSRP